LATALAGFAVAAAAAHDAAGRGAPESVWLAQAEGTEQRDLEPRYRSAPVEEVGWYNGSYIFGMTRSVAQSTISPAGKAPLFLLTVPLDLVLLPFAAIGGLFG
jgi:hypothetical protein